MKQISKRLMNWASIIDEKTLEQAKITSSMPFIFPHLALMPDAHLGKGATVGSVIPTLGAVIPAAVGVDIGCVDRDSEFLSPDGWKKISEYSGEKVMQYDPEDGTGKFVDPIAYIEKPNEFFYSFQSKYGINQMLSPDHKMLFWQRVGRDRHRVQTTMTAEDYVATDNSLVQGFKTQFETAFTPNITTEVPVSDSVLRLIVMFSADGFYAKPNSSRGVLHLRKERKIERAKALLDADSREYTVHQAVDGSTYIRFDANDLTKRMVFYDASLRQLRIISEEVLHWDGNLDDSVYFTRVRDHADFIQYAFTASGYRAVLRSDAHKKDGVIDYRVFRHDKTRVGLAGNDRTPIAKVPSVDGKAYCFTVPSGFWVMRRGGNVVMTGNCGMIAVQTQYTLADIEGLDRSVLRKAIERAIPLSAGKYNRKVVETAEPKIRQLTASAIDKGFDPAQYAGNWELQLGTLGSGNHFIEVSLDENDNVWLFLHSGSRGVGNKIAQHHIKAAQRLMKEWWIDLPDPDLAYLVEGTDEYWQYMRELHWAQDFALLNREEMMDRVIRQFTEWVDGGVVEQQRINCHHNYTSKERHFGKDVLVSRKGAIDAHEGVMGLIPGSMGTASYVVRGKGNPLGLCSAPHGAGREYSRSAARKTFTMEQLEESMQGIEFNHSTEFIDEIPAAYKPIDQVMDDASDLVEIVHTLRQIINVKGD